MHWQVREYFERYVDHFGIRDTITFNTKVEHVERLEDGTFEVRTSREGERPLYDAVLVCNGHHWDPRWPEPAFPGAFDGVEMHSHDYRDDSVLRGKRVVVVGGGNSGVDIAVAASYVSERAIVSLRRGVHVIRKRLGGKPVDQQLAPPWLPWPLKQKGFELLRKRSGNISEHGFPEPDHKIGHAHPTVSDDFLDRLADGTIVPKPNIRALRGDRVEFEDGSVEEADVIVYCTGYRVSFPFFDAGFVSAPDNDLPLYRRLFHPDIGGLYFIGLAQPLGALMPMAEESSKWVAQLLTGRYRFPGAAEIRADMEAERAAHAKRFYPSKRHTMEIDFDEWLDRAAQGARRRRRARRGRERLPAGGRFARSRASGGPGVGHARPLSRARQRSARRASANPPGSPGGRSIFSGAPGRQAVEDAALRVLGELAGDGAPRRLDRLVAAACGSSGWCPSRRGPRQWAGSGSPRCRAARSFFVSEPSRLPEARRQRCGAPANGFQARGGCRVEVGFRQITRSRSSVRRLSRLEVE